MPSLLTPEQLDQVREIITKHHAALILKLIGPEGLTDGEAELLSDEKAQEILDSIKESYLYGQAMAQANVAPEMDFEAFKNWLKKNPISLSPAENFAVQNASIRAGTHIRHLGAKVQQAMDMMVFEEDAQYRAQALREVRTQTQLNVQKRESIGALKFELGRRIEDWERDWNRVAITEKVNAMNRGVADHYREKHGDPWVYKQPMPDACKHCLRLHLGPDGKPRLFRLSTLESHGSNVGVKTANWRAVVGPVHPHCQCQLIRVPEGWGFNEEGDLVPGGKFGVKYESESDAEKAMHLEDQLQKSFRIKDRINVQGLPIAIEQRIGDVRRWTDPTGYEGETRMFFAYGYVEGTLGPDGDEYDVYVGPDPTAPFVYIVHQNDPESGEWDEDKAMVGFPSADVAKDAYLIHYDRKDFYGAMSVMPIEEFRSKTLALRRPGGLLADGMMKSDPEASGLTGRAAGGLRAEDAAQWSPAGNRAVTQGTSGPQLVIGMGSPFQHLQAAQPRVQWTPQELAGEQTRKEQRADRQFVVRKDAEIYRRIPGVDFSENVYPYDPARGPAQELGLLQIAQIPENRRFLEEEVRRRVERTAPNVQDLDQQDRTVPFSLPDDYHETLRERLVVNFGLEADEVEPAGWANQDLVSKAGPYIGPRGGKWADPKLTIPWSKQDEKRGGVRTGAIKVNPALVANVAKRALESGSTSYRNAQGKVTVEVQKGADDYDGKFQLKKKTKTGETVSQTIVLSVPDNADPKKVRAVLAHEMAHAADQGASRHAGAVSTTEGRSKAYLNQPAEVTAHLQEVQRDLLDKKAFNALKEEFEDDPGFAMTPEQFLRTHSDRGSELLDMYNDKNKKRLLKLAARVWEGVKNDTLQPIEKSVPFVGPRGGLWQDAKMTIPWKQRRGTIEVSEKKIHDTIETFLDQVEPHVNGLFPVKELVGAATWMHVDGEKVMVRIIENQPGRPYEAEVNIGKKHPTIALKVPPAHVTDKKEVGIELRNLLAHEATHVLDPGVRKNIKGVSRRAEQQKDWASYLNDPAEIAAHMQETYRDLHDKASVDRAKKVKNPLMWALMSSPTFQAIRRHLSPRNKRRAMKLIAGWHENHRAGVSTAITKARTPFQPIQWASEA